MVVKKFGRPLSQISLALFLLFALAVMANAYTVVMRGGRRVEIPAAFAVTPTTLTYEVSSGIQITLLMSAIDVAATERANNEAAGSLLKRAQAGSSTTLALPAASDPVPRSGAAQTVTDRDLKAIKEKRRRSEIAYELRRKELGLPSLEESRQKAAAELAAMDERFARSKSEEAESESYWRERASALRIEMEALDAEIRYARQRLDETEPNFSSGSVGFVSEALPIGGFGSPFGGSRFSQPYVNGAPRPNIVVSPRSGGRSGIGFGDRGNRRRIFVNPGFSQFPYRDKRGFDNSVWPGTSAFGWPWQSNDFSYEREGLVSRLDELMSARAALRVRWQHLEDEARRAGAQPGWLRP